MGRTNYNYLLCNCIKIRYHTKYDCLQNSGSSHNPDSSQKCESEISEDDLNINGNNPEGEIIVIINESYFQIVDSYKYNNEADMKRILNIIMNSDDYKSFGYTLTLKSYLSEWKAHNFAYSLYKKGDWGECTRSTDFNKNLKDNSFWYIYWLF